MSLARIAARTSLRLGRQAVFRQIPAVAPRMARMNLARAFSVSAMTQQKSSLTSSDAQLAAVLKNEIKIESSTDELSDATEYTKWLESSGFQLNSTPGKDEIELIKKEGGEVIHVFFSVSDITNGDAYDMENQFEDMEGEQAEEADLEGGEEDAYDLGASPIRTNVVIEKDGSALSIECVIQSNLLLIENVTPYESAELALSATAESDYKRREVFQGPAFSNLDENLQSALEQYLESRGVDSDLANFISDYSSIRENEEYILWLKKIQKFVEA